MLKSLVKKAFRGAGLDVRRRDPLEEAIPPAYNRSPFLPRVSRATLYRMMYFRDQLERVKHLDGDIVECGVSIGHGALLFLLLSEFVGVARTYYGFDSFEGFPPPLEKDGITPIKGPGLYASPPELVLQVLKDGRIPDEVIANRVRLVKGLFHETLRTYQGDIALLHLDCDLYDSYKIALETLYDKVRPGGVIMFDEYGDARWAGAMKAIDEFFADKPERVQPHERCDWKYFVVKR
jgi:hypothetical protein